MINAVITTVLCLGGVSLADARVTRPLPPSDSVSRYPVIVHVVSQHQTVTISSGPSGPVYSLTQADGKVLLADATGQELEKLDPQLYRHLRNYMAVKNDDASAAAEAPVGIPLADVDASR